MPSKTNKLVIEVKTSQEDAAAFSKLQKTLSGISGAQTGGGKIGGTFGSEGAMIDWIKQQAAESKKLGLQMGKVGVTQTEGGDWKASASIQKKAFGTGGMVAGMATVVGTIGGSFAKLIGLSQVFSTFMSTTGKILGTAVDLMLAPLMPIFAKIMVWIIQTVFPIATKLGNWLGGIAGDISGGGAVAALVAGYVGIKVAPEILKSMGTKLGGALLKHFDASSFGDLIMKGLKGATGLITGFGETVALKIMLGMDSAKEWFGKRGTAIKDAFTKDSGWFKTMGTSIRSSFTADDGWFNLKGTAIRDAFTADDGWFKLKGDAIREGFTATKEWFGDRGKDIQTALKPATEWFTKQGEAIQTALKPATEWFTKQGEAIQTGMKPLTTWFTTQGQTLKAAWQGGTEWWGKMGTKVSEGWEKGSAWFTKRGEDLSRGLTSLKDSKWAKGLGTAIGSGLSAAKTHLKSAGETMGRWLGGGMSTSGSFKSIGGLIGVGIGAAAIGAAIGYAIWKKYQQFQEGKDVTVGKTRLQQVRYLESLGMSEEQALTMQKSFKGEDVSKTKGGIERYMKLSLDMADQVRMFEDVQIEDLEAMERGEQLLYGRQLKEGMYGDASQYAGLIKIIEDQQWQSGATLKHAMQGITAAIQTTPSLKTAQEEKEDVPLLGHMDLNEMFWSGQGARFDRKQDEKNMRNALAGMGMDKADDTWFGTNRYREDLTKLEAEMGFWLTALQGNAASSYLTPEAQRNLADKKNPDDELVRMARGVTYTFNIVDQFGTPTNTMETFGPEDMARMKEAIANQWELVGVTLPQ